MPLYLWTSRRRLSIYRVSRGLACAGHSDPQWRSAAVTVRVTIKVGSFSARHSFFNWIVILLARKMKSSGDEGSIEHSVQSRCKDVLLIRFGIRLFLVFVIGMSTPPFHGRILPNRMRQAFMTPCHSLANTDR